MAKTAVYDYSTTASSNSDFDGTDSSGATGKVKDGDNYVRSIASHVKGFALDLGAVNTVGGTADAITVTLSSAPSALVDGMRITINASAANTGATTLNVTPAGGSAFGAKKVMKWSAGSEAELSANDIPAANALIELVYDSARNAAAGAWMLLGTSVAAATTTQQIAGTSTTVSSTPDSVAALWEAGADNTDGATITLGEGGYFNLITSTTTITAFAFATDKAGRTAVVRFDTARQITHNGTSLILPGARNITTVAGDIMEIRSLGSGNFVVNWYRPFLTIPPIITPWVAYTPTFTNFGTATNISFFSRRVGDTLEVMGKFTAGTTVNTEGRISIGFNGTDGNVSSDATKVPNIRYCGDGIADNVTTNSSQFKVLIESNVAYMTFGLQSSAGAGLTKVTGSTLLGNGWVFSMRAAIPIGGW